VIEFIGNGLTRGAIYALIALGYTMVYGILGMINFAHGEIFMIGMFACVFAIGAASTLLGPDASVNLILGAMLAITVAAAYGYANERIAYRRLRRAHLLAPLTSAIGLSIVLQNFIMLSVSKGKIDFPRHFSAPLSGNGVEISGTVVSWLQILILGVTALVMAGLFLLIYRTRLGIAMRATSQDQRMAGLVGISVNKTIAFTFVLGSAMAGLAGVMVAMYQGVLRFDSGYSMGLKAFTAAILGGIGNFPGAVLGGFIIGLSEDATSHTIGSDWKDCTTFIILMIVLILRPRGLLGERVADKV
jgi:branched-chain amino acid transport system permease protein